MTADGVRIISESVSHFHCEFHSEVKCEMAEPFHCEGFSHHVFAAARARPREARAAVSNLGRVLEHVRDSMGRGGTPACEGYSGAVRGCACCTFMRPCRYTSVLECTVQMTDVAAVWQLGTAGADGRPPGEWDALTEFREGSPLTVC